MALLLLDNNVFQALTHVRGQGDLSRFFEQLGTAGLVPRNAAPSLKLTPFSILEAIGLLPPSPELSLPNPLPRHDVEDAVVEHLLGQALDFFERHPDLSEQNLLRNAEAQRTYTKPSAMAFFDRCVTQVVAQPTARLHMIACLAADAMFKYPFAPALAPYMHARFLQMLFSRDEIDNSASLLRVMKRIWDNLYPQMRADAQSFQPDRVAEAFRRMRLKNSQDYVDCDLVHYLCVGYVDGTNRSPIIGFTTDNFDTVATRIAVFKAIAEQYRSKALEITGRDSADAVVHEAGTLVICSSAAEITNVTPVANILEFDTAEPRR